ncbi:hypothetical protein QNI22_05295 [Cytophagaceae bacterium BD1B2-1]|uniref:Uncharacterized protein n=1 Tax=Xanthocytophaga agilis TaxID=3048010 RepID=A0AAE3QXX1_9BACT|nr:hypothetical protein [Xanthocytophaga agilis]
MVTLILQNNKTDMHTMPENITELLHWFKERTESFWNADLNVNSDECL